MKSFFLFAVFLSSAVSFAAATVPKGRQAKFYYFEIVPNETLPLTFSAPKHCKNDSEKIDIKEFVSEQRYLSAETGKPTSVRVLNIYVEAFSPCSTPALGDLSKEHTILIEPKRMTHVYITVSEGVDLGSTASSNKKMLSLASVMAKNKSNPNLLMQIDLAPVNDTAGGKRVFKIRKIENGSVFEKEGLKVGDLISE